MRYAGDAGELEAFSCAVGDLYSNAEWVTLGKSGHEWKWTLSMSEKQSSVVTSIDQRRILLATAIGGSTWQR